MDKAQRQLLKKKRKDAKLGGARRSKVGRRLKVRVRR